MILPLCLHVYPSYIYLKTTVASPINSDRSLKTLPGMFISTYVDSQYSITTISMSRLAIDACLNCPDNVARLVPMCHRIASITLWTPDDYAWFQDSENARHKQHIQTLDAYSMREFDKTGMLRDLPSLTFLKVSMLSFNQHIGHLLGNTLISLEVTLSRSAGNCINLLSTLHLFKQLQKFTFFSMGGTNWSEEAKGEEAFFYTWLSSRSQSTDSLLWISLFIPTRLTSIEIQSPDIAQAHSVDQRRHSQAL